MIVTSILIAWTLTILETEIRITNMGLDLKYKLIKFELQPKFDEIIVQCALSKLFVIVLVKSRWKFEI